MSKQCCSRKHICHSKPKSNFNLMNIFSLLSPSEMKVYRESPKINSNNLLGSSFFRVKLKGQEHLTKMSQASQPLILSAKVTPWMSREGNVVICLRSLRMEAFPFLAPWSSRVSVFLHWSYCWKWTLEVTHSMSRWWGYPEFYRDSWGSQGGYYVILQTHKQWLGGTSIYIPFLLSHTAGLLLLGLLVSHQ